VISSARKPIRLHPSQPDTELKLMYNRTVLSRYIICGFISSGTYGRVYKARARSPSSDASPRGLMGTPSAGGAGVGTPRKVDGEEESEGELFAIKKFKPDKEGEAVTYTGISQSACREIMVCTSWFGETEIC
jgi:cyclin-dependent kinase 8/11